MWLGTGYTWRHMGCDLLKLKQKAFFSLLVYQTLGCSCQSCLSEWVTKGWDKTSISDDTSIGTDLSFRWYERTADSSNCWQKCVFAKGGEDGVCWVTGKDSGPLEKISHRVKPPVLNWWSAFALHLSLLACNSLLVQYLLLTVLIVKTVLTYYLLY